MRVYVRSHIKNIYIEYIWSFLVVTPLVYSNYLD